MLFIADTRIMFDVNIFTLGAVPNTISMVILLVIIKKIPGMMQ
jgi:hypothetical protein